jgi:citrate lyase beta subunit
MKSLESGLARSYLYVPAVAGDRLARAASRGADAVIADLEDSVPPSRKAEALAAAVAWLRERRDAVERWVRVNPGREGPGRGRSARSAASRRVLPAKVRGLSRR